MTRSNKEYPEAYNVWAGNPKGVAPDFERCCESVHGRERWPTFHQCTKPRGHGPGEAYCKQHDPAAKAARDLKSRRDYAIKNNKERPRWYGTTFLKALREIAAGHNDARGLATEVLAEFDKGAMPVPGDPEE